MCVMYIIYDFTVPPTVRRSDAARVLEEYTLPPMPREVPDLLRLQAVPPLGRHSATGEELGQDYR